MANEQNELQTSFFNVIRDRDVDSMKKMLNFDDTLKDSLILVAKKPNGWTPKQNRS